VIEQHIRSLADFLFCDVQEFWKRHPPLVFIEKAFPALTIMAL
jgi:hypothetical protein